mmetsp:Transcript_33168/g.103440  ORF Transcript_33168/g.103440 Transcript_33168/m.103440 type:complete len:301 (+) Transcript_33168:66-968(+)
MSFASGFDELVSNGFGHFAAGRFAATPVSLAISECAFFIVLCIVVSTLTGNVSQVDKLWSITPAVYAWTLSDLGDSRQCLLSALITLWAARLTFNFARRGGYGWPPWTGEEDYRWAVCRTWPGLNTPLGWHAFNIGFISLYQHALLLMICAPVAAAGLSRSALGPLDALAALAFLACLALEAAADQQQWEYQQEKHRLRSLRKAEDTPMPERYARGFNAEGLFAVSRHPNFVGEQGVWLSVVGFGVAAGVPVLHWSGVGALLLVLLFQGSTALTESITLRKYPQYAEYQRSVGRLLPRLF